MYMWSCAFTNYLYELNEHNSVLQVMPQVCDGLQAWFLLQLSVHPGNIGCQLLLQSCQSHAHKFNKPQENVHNRLTSESGDHKVLKLFA